MQKPVIGENSTIPRLPTTAIAFAVERDGDTKTNRLRIRVHLPEGQFHDLAVERTVAEELLAKLEGVLQV